MFSVEQPAVIGAILDFRHSLPAFVSLRHRETYQLKDLARPELVYELLHPDLPGAFHRSSRCRRWLAPGPPHRAWGSTAELLAKWRK